METYMLRLSALVALIPAALFVFRTSPKRDLVFWSVLGVALASGFVSASHFSKCYHEYFDKTPRDERREAA